MSDDAPRDFGTAYDGARKGYGVASGLLLGWELLGIRIDKVTQEVGAIKFNIVHPEAVTLTLSGVVAYFACRLTIEWFQAEAARRRLPSSRLDLFFAHIIGTSALLLYAYQSRGAYLLSAADSQFIAQFVAGFVSIGIFPGIAANHFIRSDQTLAKLLKIGIGAWCLVALVLPMGLFAIGAVATIQGFFFGSGIGVVAPVLTSWFGDRIDALMGSTHPK